MWTNAIGGEHPTQPVLRAARRDQRAEEPKGQYRECVDVDRAKVKVVRHHQADGACNPSHDHDEDVDAQHRPREHCCGRQPRRTHQTHSRNLAQSVCFVLADGVYHITVSGPRTPGPLGIDLV